MEFDRSGGRMTLPRISIKKLMAWMAMIAIGLAALARPNLGWAVILSTTYVIMLLTAVLGVILRRGPRQAYWIGFGLFGWRFYTAITLLAERFDTSGSQSNSNLTNILNIGMETCYSIISDFKENFTIALLYLVETNIRSIVSVVQSLIGLVFSAVGGQIALILAKGGPFDPSPRTPG